MNKYDGGPAFPVPSVGTGDPRDGMTVGHNGMSLRDWFAGQALIGIAQRNPTGSDTIKWHLKHAYKYADALLEERQRYEENLTKTDRFPRYSKPYEDCVAWAAQEGLGDTRALNVIGRAGISCFDQITREVLEDTAHCGDRTMRLILKWMKSRLDAGGVKDAN